MDEPVALRAPLKEELMTLAAALPDKPGKRAVREVCLTLCEDGTWGVMAGGHPAVHIGEWGGDFQGDGATPEEAIAACLASINAALTSSEREA